MAKLEPVLLKRHPTLNERWVQEQIANDPTILGLGDIVLRDRERIQMSGGRLDLLLQDPETLKRYEVEIQLGTVDESHIIRTIEYWDLERKRYPQYEHAAVIVAEEITSRFLNVISLFNGSIPLIALKMTAYKVGEQVFLTFVKVMDEVVYGLVDEDEQIAEPTDRAYWEKRSSKKSLDLMDYLMTLVNEVEPTATPKYNKHYVGLSVDGSPSNFVDFKPRKSGLIMTFRLPKTEENDQLIDDCGLDTLEYVTRWRQYRIRIESRVTDIQKTAILELAKRAKESFGKSS
jgi:hypothetical protein